MAILIAAGEPYPTAMAELLRKEFDTYRIPVVTQGVHIELDAVVLVEFMGVNGKVLALSERDLHLGNEVLAELLKAKLVTYHYVYAREIRDPQSVPLTTIRIPRETPPDTLPKWAKAVVRGVRQYLLKRQQFITAQ